MYMIMIKTQVTHALLWGWHVGTAFVFWGLAIAIVQFALVPYVVARFPSKTGEVRGKVAVPETTPLALFAPGVPPFDRIRSSPLTAADRDDQERGRAAR